jgi:hypothetical protein
LAFKIFRIPYNYVSGLSIFFPYTYTKYDSVKSKKKNCPPARVFSAATDDKPGYFF